MKLVKYYKYSDCLCIAIRNPEGKIANFYINPAAIIYYQADPTRVHIMLKDNTLIVFDCEGDEAREFMRTALDRDEVFMGEPDLPATAAN